ncbi:MAG: transporter substrate-binding domain-containing protein [Sulfurospirillaceae bacterium]|nr:transporter substrate-binding domain-containing protein [Sulfurospirillaceae bacterium]
MRLLSVWLLMLLSSLLMGQQTLKVGIYDNAPKIFLDEQNNPSGFFIELLSAIAKDANLTLSYAPCSWEQCLEKLEKGEIDIMPDVAYSKDRANRFDFNEEAVVSSWSIIYATPEANILSILDLHRKKIAVLKESFQYISLKEQAIAFDIKPLFIEVDTFDEAFKLLITKKADVALVNNFYGELYEKTPTIKKTNVFLTPAMLKFAFPKNTNPSLINTIDTHLKTYKQNQSSIYYDIKKRWLESKDKEILPSWAKWGLGIMALIIMGLICSVLFFKYLLSLKITELREKEQMLLAQSRNAIMGEMLSMIAHQWKQPLAVLSMLANNIKVDIELGTFDKKIADDLQKEICEQIFYLSRTIDDFRDFLKPNKEKYLTEELSGVVEQALGLIGKTLESHNITIFKAYSKVENLLIYPSELMQVIINILQNAKDAFIQNKTPHPSISIHVYQKEDSAYIEIEDNAGGIKNEILKNIFEPYFTTKSETGGSGLGLYMSKVIIESHFYGTIKVSSSEENSTFVISFPIKKNQQ